MTGNEGLYANLEAILAFSIVLVPLLDFGIKSYVGYRFNRSGADCFARFDALSLQVVLINLALAIPLYFINELMFIYVMAIFRAIHINLYQYILIKGLLCESRIKPMIVSIFSSTSSVCIALSLSYSGVSDNMMLFCYFILPPCVFLGYHLIQYKPVKGERLGPSIIDPFNFSMIKFSLPVIMNSLLVVGFANLTKIYILNKFGQADMIKYSFDFRIAMGIHLVHSAISVYLIKFFLVSVNSKRMIKIYCLYMTVLLVGVAIALVFVYYLGPYLDPKLLILDLLLCVIFGYTILWCFSAFLDVLYVRMNKTSLVLVNSCVFFTSFILFYFFVGISTPLFAAIGLLISAAMMWLSSLVLVFSNHKHLK
jgi:hypothetical protein